MSLEQLRTWCQEAGEPAYRGTQLFDWLYKRGATDPAIMANLPSGFRGWLAENTLLSAGSVVGKSASALEPTLKYLIHLEDGSLVETVSMLEAGRHTVCLSSQVGCNVGCTFCATASMGLVRNLHPGEIIDQLLLVQEDRGIPATNVVFMGMGEPLLNYASVIAAAEIMHHPRGLNIGAQRITISTVGIVPRIKQYTDEQQPYRLAISLNATDDQTRAEIMPLDRKWNLEKLLNAARNHARTSKRAITFEYVLLAGINDSIKDAGRLARLVSNIKCKINLIPYNEAGAIFRKPLQHVIEAFAAQLKEARIPVTIRWSNGVDIAAGCGQLAAPMNLQEDAQVSTDY